MPNHFLVAGGLLLVVQSLDAATQVTFNHDVAPILYRNCSECHHPGEAAPFSLMSYQDALKKGKMIAKVTGSGVMPPWKAEPASFAYRDERRLKDQDIAAIRSWVEGGMPEGNASEKPESPKFASGWRLGEPDLIIEMPAAYHVPAGGPDIYRNIAVPVGNTEDKWITAIDMHPSARAAVHHVLYFADPRGRIHERSQQGAEPGFSGMRAGGASVPLGGWALGAQPHFFPEGLALELPKGSDLVIQYHFHPTGKPEVEKSLIGFYFAKKAPERMMTRVQMPPTYSLFSDLNIPPGEKDFVIRDSYELPVGIEAVGVSAHAHYLGKQMIMKAMLPGGVEKTLLVIKDWDFARQDRYFFKDLQALPKGTRLDVEIHWDNSAGNRRNPSSPPVAVSWGEETKDEMGSISLIAVAQNESELPALRRDLNERRNELARSKMRSDPELARKVARLMAE
jgi:hypothetical protein